MQHIFAEETKRFNVFYHSNYEKALKTLASQQGRKLRKKVLLKEVIERYYQAYTKGEVMPTCTKIRKETCTTKPRFAVQLELKYHEMFDEIFLNVKALEDDTQQVRFTKTKLLEEMLGFWLESEGKDYERIS